MHCTHNGPAKNAALIILINTTHCAINGFVLGIMCSEWGVSSCAGGVWFLVIEVSLLVLFLAGCGDLTWHTKI